MSTLIEEIRTLFQRNPAGAVHLLGVGGVGMAGLAACLHARGYKVSGCDLAENRLTQRLVESGVPCLIGHDPAHLSSRPFCCVRSTAVPLDHPELWQATQLGVPIFQRGEVFAALLRDERVVAISGTHGKTTTTALCAHTLRAVAEGRSPSFFIGGEWELPGRVFERGTLPVTVVEADESDGTVRHYAPSVAVVTGIDYDHMEHFESEADFVSVFSQFMRQAKQAVVYCADDQRLTSILPPQTRAISYGFHSDARWRADNLEATTCGSCFDVYRANEPIGRYTLSVPGTHNVQNALATLAVAESLGYPPERAAESWSSFVPVRRRLELLGEVNGAAVYSDYAHHPTEIRALLSAIPALGHRRHFAIFQPHRYTRTRALAAEFPGAFDGLDAVVLVPVYAASEKSLPGGAHTDLARHFIEGTHVPLTCVDHLEAAWEQAVARLEPGDALFLIGAGDIETLGANVIQPDSD